MFSEILGSIVTSGKIAVSNIVMIARGSEDAGDGLLVIGGNELATVGTGSEVMKGTTLLLLEDAALLDEESEINPVPRGQYDDVGMAE